MFRKILAATGVVALALPAYAHAATVTPVTPAIAAAPAVSDDVIDRFETSESSGKIDSDITPRSLTSDAKVQVIVEVKGDPVAVVEADQGRTLSGTERKAVRDKLRNTQDTVAGGIRSRGGKVTATMQSAYNGMRVQIAGSQVAAVAALPNVVAVHAVPVYHLDNATSVPFLGVPQVWQNTGYTGKKVKVAVIDTGIDYTHANFAGPGTVAAYDAAHAAEAEPADPALFGPNSPRVKGGWDFVGDDYDADPSSPTYQPVPHPDPNPLDCNGHGSHVAGTTGGNGVLADGSTYTGPYDASTPSKSWKIGPGVAPQVDLYALRVFGCEGSTDVTTEAIDWAVANDMDVINMSLGSSFGTADDPSAVAAKNAVGAGVVVVASAGNSGPNPYITGSPGTGDGVIAVSAVDSTASFPGAQLTFSNGTSLAAIRSNSAPLVSGALNVVVLSGADALGCSVAAFQNAGIVPGGNQLAVVTRGTCARVAKAIYGQQAGAAAVLQINTDAGYPPYEGDITSNPDTGEPYTVTIPFLGVRSTDGAAVRAAAGSTVTMAEQPLVNPSFRGYASFSSSGPRNGDSAISPNVAAPGVSIVSTGVGTGNEPATISGTSMAAPHVAGVAALAVQAHPKWRASEIAAALSNTADPDKVAGQSLVRGGVGLVDPAQVVSTQVVVGGDPYRTTSGWFRDPSLSFGFAEPSHAYVGVKTLTIANKGTKTVTYKLSTTANPESKPATVRLSARTITVKPGRTAAVVVGLYADASKLGSSSGTDQFALNQVSGNVVLTSGSEVLRVPYLLVPRAQAKVAAQHSWYKVKSPAIVTLTNAGGALDANADFYTWGLSDPKDVAKTFGGSGYDLRAAGVQSFPVSATDALMVFAVNNHTRWSNAATNEFDVEIDTNGDGAPDWVVFSYDSGVVRTGSANGLTEVFLVDVATGGLSATGFLATAPTDSSTILLPVYASDLGLTPEAGKFGYTVASYSQEDSTAGDSFASSATYNPWAKAIEDGQFETVAASTWKPKTTTVTAAIDPTLWAQQKPLGLMAVVLDNKSGAGEAVLISGKK